MAGPVKSIGGRTQWGRRFTTVLVVTTFSGRGFGEPGDRAQTAYFTTCA